PPGPWATRGPRAERPRLDRPGSDRAGRVCGVRPLIPMPRLAGPVGTTHQSGFAVPGFFGARGRAARVLSWPSLTCPQVQTIFPSMWDDAAITIPLRAPAVLRGTAVGHLDADCFYVSAERVRDEFLRGKPVGVLGNQGACVIAKSYEMKADGVKTGEPIWE